VLIEYSRKEFETQKLSSIIYLVDSNTFFFIVAACIMQEDGDEDADGLYDDVDALYGDELIQVIDNVDVHVPILPDKVLHIHSSLCAAQRRCWVWPLDMTAACSPAVAHQTCTENPYKLLK
jgi:hypothetical protein